MFIQRNSKDAASISEGYIFIHKNLIFHKSVPLNGNLTMLPGVALRIPDTGPLHVPQTPSQN